MEIQSNVFLPKYLFTAYLKPLVYSIGFFVIGFVMLQRGWYTWEYVLVLVLIGFNAFQETKSIIKEIEFDESEMIICYVLWMEKSVDYHAVRNIDPNISISFEGAFISLKGMMNGIDLQKRIAEILREKKIREINIEEEIKKKSKAGKKIYGYAFAFTFFVGVVASSIVTADLATWALLLFLLFAFTVIILALFVKP